MKNGNGSEVKGPVSVEYFFEQVGSSGCGVCVVNTILKMFGKRGLIFMFSKEKGTSPFRILHELRKGGLDAVRKEVTIAYLKNYLENVRLPAILYLPRPIDHYVVVKEIIDDCALVYDSAKKEPYWCRLSELKRKWYKIYRGRMRGWLIEIKPREGAEIMPKTSPAM